MLAQHQIATCTICNSHDRLSLVYIPRMRKSVDDSQFYAERVDRIPDANRLRKWTKGLPKPVAVFCTLNAT